VSVGRIVTHTPTGKQRHVGGRRRPFVTPQTHPRLFRSVRRYMTAPLPAAPASFDYYSAARAALSDVLANNRLGDCTSAGALHAEEAISAAAGAPVVFQEADAIKFYSLSTGYNPADPTTDQGGDEYTVLSTWKEKGLDGHGAHKIAGFVAVDPSEAALVKSVCWLFENLYFGIELADSWTQVSDGGTWDVGQPPDPKDGHCVVGVGGSDAGIVIDTWGELVTMTWAAVESFCDQSNGGQLFAVLTPEIIARAQEKSPEGFDWPTLVDDMNALSFPIGPGTD